MSSEAIASLLEQSKNDFLPPINFQIDTTHIQNIFQGLCNQMLKMQKEMEALQVQLNSKANQNDLANFAAQIDQKVDDAISQREEDVSRIDNNVNDLKNALLAGLDKCRSDAGAVAREMVSDIKPSFEPKPSSTKESSRSKNVLPSERSAKDEQKSSRSSRNQITLPQPQPQVQTVYLQTPIPTADLSELTRQLQCLSERVLAIEARRDPNTPVGDLRDRMSELEKRAQTLSQRNSSTPTFSQSGSQQNLQPSSSTETKTQSSSSSSSKPNTSSADQQPPPQQSQPSSSTAVPVLSHQPPGPSSSPHSLSPTVADIQAANQLYDLNNAIRILNERLSLLENEGNVPNVPPSTESEVTRPRSQRSPQQIVTHEVVKEAPDDIYKLLNEHSDQIKKLTSELDEVRNKEPSVKTEVVKEIHHHQEQAPSQSPALRVPSPVRIEVPSDNKEAISQLNDRLFECENNLSNFAILTNELRDQLFNQKSQLENYRDLMDKIKEQAIAAAKQAAKTAVAKAVHANPPKPSFEEDEKFKELYDLDEAKSASKPDSKKEARDGEEEDGEPDSIRSSDFGDQNARSNSDDEEEKPKRSNSPPPPRPSLGSLNTDELLDTFLDATRAEVDKARKGILDEIAANIRALSVQLSGNISKTAASFDIGLKKANTRITDQGSQFQSDMKSHNYEQQNTVKDLHVADAELQEKIRSIEQRVDALTAAANAPPPKMETLVGEDGKIDLGPLLMQIQAQMALCSDLSSRIQALEQKEQVSPTAFNSVVETLGGHESKLSSLEVTTVQTDMKLAELREIQDEMRNKQNNPEEDLKFQELREMVMSLEDETKRLRDAMVKFNKDLIACRAAINTLRSHSEEMAASIDDIRKISEQTRDDTAATDKRLKKVIVFIQNENKDLTNQIKDVSRSVERNADRIEEIANRKIEPQIIVKKETEQQNQNEPSESSSKPSTPKPLLPQKNENQLENIMTSPHVVLPPMEDSSTINDPSSQLLIPKIPPQQPVIQQSSQQVVQLPPQVVYEQPIVTVVRKQVEIENAARAAKSSLPRLNKAPGPRSQSEVTRNDLRKYDEIFGRLDQYDQKFASLKSAIEGLNKQIKILQDTKAEKDALQALFDQFRLAMGELNNRIGSLRKSIIQKADIGELQQLRNEVAKEIKIQGETAAGTEQVRCLLCGNPRHNISGAIEDPLMQKFIGPGVSSRVTGADGAGNVCFVYGEHGEMFQGRSVDGKPIVLKNLINDPGNTGNGEIPNDSRMAPGETISPPPEAQ